MLLLLAQGPGTELEPVQPCTADRDCRDGLFCNGQERCQPGDPDADKRGCIAAPRPPCDRGTVCREDADACIRPCRDADGDGHDAVDCGGDDCDDRDPNRYPGNVELCDAAGHDEDCDPTTFGFRDEDRDGEADARCCNTDGSGVERCGADCDDSNRSVLPNAQVCDARNVAICTGGLFQPARCLGNTVCIPQPNGTGVCGAEPPGYETPPRRVQPRPRPLPGLEEMKKQLEKKPPAAVQPRIPLKTPMFRVPPPSKKRDGGGAGQ
jgi:hypothetical protein